MRHITYRELTECRRFGVELEVSSDVHKSEIGQKLDLFEQLFGLNKNVRVTTDEKQWAETKSNDYWHVKYDSTCGPKGKGKDHGWEIASYIAQGYDDLYNISKATDWLAEFLTTNKNCGLHIHVDVSDFSQKDMGVLLTHWMAIEHVLLAICNFSRTNNYYCRSLWPRMENQIVAFPCLSLDNPTNFWKLMQPRNFNTHNNEDKKYSINTVGFAIGQIIENHSRKTIELRLPECNLSSDHVLGWVSLFLNFVDTCRDLQPRYPISRSNELSYILQILGLEGNNDFCILEYLLHETKRWFLQKLSKSKIDPRLKDQALNHLEFISKI